MHLRALHAAPRRKAAGCEILPRTGMDQVLHMNATARFLRCSTGLLGRSTGSQQAEKAYTPERNHTKA
jgi:hypothetical protein